MARPGLEWMDRPVTITAGEYDRLNFAEYRLNQMREIVRKMYGYEQDRRVPLELRELMIGLTCKVRVDDADDADDAENAALIGSRPDIELAVESH